MADKEIPDLTDAGAAVSGDLVHAVRSGNSRKMALGDAAGKNVGPAASEVAAGNHSHAAQVITITDISLEPVTLTDGATVALNASQGSTFLLTAGGDREILAPTTPVNDGQRIIIRHKASAAGRTLSLNSGTGGFRFGSDITALSQTASGKADYIGCIYHETDNKWDVVAVAKGYGA